MNNDNCVFCQIISGQLEAKIEYQSEDLIVIHDIHPQAPVHLLVLPKKHFAGLEVVKSEDQSLVGGLQVVMAEMIAKFKIDGGFKVELNGGKYQDVKHLHYHLKGGM